MPIILHENPEAYAAEYALVRSKLVAEGTSLNQWLKERNISRQLAYRALLGVSLGKKAVAVRRTILSNVLGLETGNVPMA